MAKMAELKMATVPVSKINLAPYNPRKDLQPGDDEYERIARSIEMYGYVDPLIWNKRTKNLVGGHQRFKILLDQGVTHAQVSVVDLPDEDEKALNIALNKLSGDWDQTKLLEVLTSLNEAQYDLSLTGFDESEIKKMLEHELSDESLSVAETKHERMEIRPYEHYDYIVFFFRDVRDFVAACEKYGVKKVETSFTGKHGKLGLGRVLDGRRLIDGSVGPTPVRERAPRAVRETLSADDLEAEVTELEAPAFVEEVMEISEPTEDPNTTEQP